MKHRRITGLVGIASSELKAHMDGSTIPLQQRRTVRRCQRKIGALMDELNQVTKQLATIWMSYPPNTAPETPLGEAVKALDVLLLDGDTVSGWLDDWILAREAQEHPHDTAE